MFNSVCTTLLTNLEVQILLDIKVTLNHPQCIIIQKQFNLEIEQKSQELQSQLFSENQESHHMHAACHKGLCSTHLPGPCNYNNGADGSRVLLTAQHPSAQHPITVGKARFLLRLTGLGF